MLVLRIIGVWLLLLLPASAAGSPLSRALEALDSAPCELDPAFRCASLPLPEAPADPSLGTFNLHFAVRPASRRRNHGALVIVDGGPGVVGLDWIDDLRWVDPKLSRRFHLIYYDQRGAGASGGLGCPVATAAWMATPTRATTPEAFVGVAAQAEAFAAACVAESGWDPERLARLHTQHAVADLAGLLTALGQEKATLYGLSYGTQLGQEFAATHPERVRALVLDGVVDLTTSGLDYATELNEAVHLTLRDTFAACGQSPACAADLPDPAASYARVAARLGAGPVQVEAPMAAGPPRTRSLSRSDLDVVVHGSVGDALGRAAFLRVLAAADRDDNWLPLRRLADAAHSLNAESLRYESEGFSDAMYYAVTCNDYGRAPGGVEAWAARAAEVAAADPAVITPLFGDLPCAFWPGAPDAPPRPPPFQPTAFPVLVAGATADVATPAVQGWRVHAAVAEVQPQSPLVRVEGGHHVLWGSETCADPVINRFLIDPAHPKLSPLTVCEDPLAPYAPLAGPDPARSGPELATAIAHDLTFLWDFGIGEAWGCPGGGSVELVDDVLDLTDCAQWPGVQVSGEAWYRADRVQLNVWVEGTHEGMLRVSDGRLRGTYDGERVRATLDVR